MSRLAGDVRCLRVKRQNPSSIAGDAIVGVLRLRGKCAMRTFHCTQDDRELMDAESYFGG
jgi:hypothetical protein